MYRSNHAENWIICIVTLTLTEAVISKIPVINFEQGNSAVLVITTVLVVMATAVAVLAKPEGAAAAAAVAVAAAVVLIIYQQYQWSKPSHKADIYFVYMGKC